MKKAVSFLSFILLAVGSLPAQTRSFDTETNTITIEIPAQNGHYVLYDRIPDNTSRAVLPTDISDAGVFDASTRLIKWGPFKGEALTVSYRLVTELRGPDHV